MAISDKLNYLIETKSQLKDMINYGLDDDNKITSSTTFRNYVGSVFKVFLESLNNPSTLFNNLPKITGTGSNITLNNTANAPMRIELGATELSQDATPTPSSPQDIHTISGSNTLKVNNIQEADIDLGYENVLDLYRYPYNKADSDLYGGEVYIENGIITIDGTNATSNMTARSLTPASNKRDIIKAGTYYFNVRCNLRKVSDNTLYQPTIGTNTLAEDYYLSQWFATTQVGEITTYKMQVVKGNKDVPYTEYGKSIQYCKIGNYEDKFIRTSGENEYDINTNPLENSSTTRVRTTGYISLKAGTHTISYTGANKIYAVYYDSNNTKIGETNWTIGNLTFTFNQDYKYVFYFGKTGDTTITTSEITNIMLNKGTTALPYEPYGSNEWYIKKNIGKVVLDGSENWEMYGSSGARKWYVTPFDNQNTTSQSIKMVSTSFKWSQYISGNWAINQFGYHSGAKKNVFDTDFGESLSDWTTRLASNPVTVDYPLATSEYIPITGTLAEQLEYIYQLLKSYKGVTNISQVNNDLAFELDVEAVEDIE